MTRTFVHPNWVQSKNDGDSHFIGFAQLCRLYMVRPDKAFRVDPEQSTDMGHTWAHRMPWGMRPMEGDVHLYPRYDGDYPLFEENR